MSDYVVMIAVVVLNFALALATVVVLSVIGGGP